ncbi:DUF4328 domain-containing protein [Dactylosporangium sp. AC04546]|uniref:DUF4328 domain-containing protein n=1 Tax=Dactylosporangium sp. AC04546 TaxID=2862460 RepID=UPI002E7AB312|nr:DUF4328 domain-containing protein [Dactylosporangium sp. AC04546]WVK88114.1 DUF4328 domain-containing protein [Dactylosporangium sp. AC04546]
MQTIGWVVVAALAAVSLAHVFTVVRAYDTPEPGTGRIVQTQTNFGLSVFSGEELGAVVLNSARTLVLVVFIVWLYLARDNFDRRNDNNVGWRKGWTIGGWFIPLANLVIPYLVVKEIFARSSPDRTWTSDRVVTAWWLALIVSLFSYTEATTWADGTTQVTTPTGVAIVTAAAGALAALMGALLVRRVTTWQDGAPATA